MAFSSSRERYRFGAFELQLDERRLLKDGAPVSLRPRALDLLAIMVERAGHLVTKDELLEHVWPGVVVEDAVVHVQVSALRKILGSDAIVTISGQGYRFALSVSKGAALPKHNLPSQLTSFIGREQEIAQLEELVISNRLTTLTGAGGVGKTRLALQIAHKLVDQFVDGVWLVELAALSDAGLVTQSVAQTLGIKELPGKPLSETLSDHLASKHLLLVLDNAEHLLGACVELADRTLRRGARVSILVTSRERLGMTGELTYRVPSLTVPDPDAKMAPEALSVYEGVRLFVERAKLLRPHFTITNENAAAVASICHRLDGIPLAIELAAPRLRSMSVEELSNRLDHRLALLAAGAHAPFPRHRTLRAMIDWSYDLLSDVEKSMLQRLAVFAGGWTLEAAEQVCAKADSETAGVIDLLSSLIDKKLISSEEDDGATRYRLLETVRQYAGELLHESGEATQWRSRHLAHFLALGEEAYPALAGADQGKWAVRLVIEHDNFRAALSWSLGANPEQGLRLANGLSRFWRVRGYLAEARSWHHRLLEATEASPVTVERAKAVYGAGVFALMQTDYAAAEPMFEKALALGRDLNDPERIAYTLCSLGALAIEQARYADAETLLQESLAVSRTRGDRTGIAYAIQNLGVARVFGGQFESASALYEESVAIARDSGDQRQLAMSLKLLGDVERRQGMLAYATVHETESLRIVLGLSDNVQIAEVLANFANIAIASGEPRRAACLWAAGERLRNEIGSPVIPRDLPLYEEAKTAARTALGDKAFHQAWGKGSAMPLDDAVQFALARNAGP
jgi:non-specific serine/threonine protein kinase